MPARTLPLSGWSRVNAALLLLATVVALGVRDTAPYVVVGCLSFVGLLVLCRGGHTPSGAFGRGNAVTALRFLVASSVGLVPDEVPTWVLGLVVFPVFLLDGADG